MNGIEDGLPIEEFIQALTSQLDRAQATLGVKAKLGMPLTFAVKDLTIELRAHIDVVQGQVRIRSAGPRDTTASVINIALTTITRPMIEENTLDLEPDEPSLKEVLGEDVTDEERRRLEWAGIHNARQLRELQQQSGEHVIERIVQIPAQRLRSALMRASQPKVRAVAPAGPDRIRIQGRNLVQKGRPQVRIGGKRAEIIEANKKELIVKAPVKRLSGMLSVETAPGDVAAFDLDADTPLDAAPPETDALPDMTEAPAYPDASGDGQ